VEKRPRPKFAGQIIDVVADSSRDRDFEVPGGLLRVRLFGRKRVVFERWEDDKRAWESTMEAGAQYDIEYTLDSMGRHEAVFHFRGDEMRGRGFVGGRVTVRLSDGTIG